MPNFSNRILYPVSVLLTVCAYLINVNGLNEVSIVVVTVGVLLTLLNTEKGCQFFFIMALAFGDYTFNYVYGTGGSQTASLGGIYMATIGGSTLMVYWGLLTLGLIFIKKANWVASSLWSKRIFKILGVMFISSIVGFTINLIIGGKYVLTAASSDVAFYIYIVLGFLVISVIVKNRRDLKRYFNVFLLVLLTHLIITIIASYITSLQSLIFTFFSGSGVYYDTVLLVFLLFFLKERKKVQSVNISPTVIFSGLIIVLLFLFVVPSRGKMIALGLCFLIYSIYSRQWKLLFIMPVCFLAAIYLVKLINPNFYQAFLFKFSTINPYAEASNSSTIRLIELKNIIGELFSNPYYLIFGKGLGGFFQTDFASFASVHLGTHSYPAGWIAEGKFYRPHGTIIYLLLKNGLVMTIVFYYAIFQLFRKGTKLFKNKIHSYSKIIAISFLFCLPVLSLIIFSAKLQIMFGMMLGFIFLALKITNKDRKTLVQSAPNPSVVTQQI